MYALSSHEYSSQTYSVSYEKATQFWECGNAISNLGNAISGGGGRGGRLWKINCSGKNFSDGPVSRFAPPKMKVWLRHCRQRRQRKIKSLIRVVYKPTHTLVINYWTRSSKISRFVGGEQINYLPMPKAEANNWSASHRQIVIFSEISSNNCFIIHLQSITLSFVKINELYTQTLFLKKLPDYIVFVDFPCLQILPKDIDGRFSSFFVFSEFFSCSKQDNSSSDSSCRKTSRHCLQKVEAMRMLRLLFV